MTLTFETSAGAAPPLATGTSRKAPPDDSDECDLQNIDTLIQDLTQSLALCDSKAAAPRLAPTSTRREIRDAAQACAKAAPGGAGLSSADPVQSPDAWWDTGLRYAFEWLRHAFLERLSDRANGAVRRTGLGTVLTWREHDCRVSLDAGACSLALMLQPWTATASEEPRGMRERHDGALREVRTLEQSLDRMVAVMEGEARGGKSAALSETLLGTARAMRTLVALGEKERCAQRDFAAATHRNGLVAARALGIVQKWVFDRALRRLDERLEAFDRFRAELDAEFANPLRTIDEQRRRFGALWAEVKSRYDRFLASQGLDDRDRAAVTAMDAATDLRPDSFGPESVRLLRQYIEHIRRIAHTAPAGTTGAECDADPVRRLHAVYERKRVELIEVNDALDRARQCSSSEKAEEIDALEQRRQRIGRLAENCTRLLRRYLDYPLDRQNQWLDAVDRLGSDLECAQKEWGRVVAARHRREAQLEEETRASLRQLEDATYAGYDADVARLLHRWSEHQQGAMKRRDDDLKQLAMERYVATEWLTNFERKLVYFGGATGGACGAGASTLLLLPSAAGEMAGTEMTYPKRIADFRSLLALTASARESLARIEDFEGAFRHLVEVWRLVYGVQCDADLTPPPIHRS